MVKFPAAAYVGEKGTYLAAYSHHPDIQIAIPPSLKGGAERIAQIAYSKGGSRKGISIFRLNGVARALEASDVPELRITKTLVDSKRVDPQVDRLHGIECDVLYGTPNEVLDLARADIRDFCEGKTPKTPIEPRTTYHQIIVPETRIRIIEPERILTPGKPEFTPSCSLEASIDDAKGCISGWLPGENASFDGRTFTNFRSAPWGECRYCYAMPKHKAFVKTIYNIDPKRLKEELQGEARLTTGSDVPLGRPVSVLRFGKRTEAGSEYTRENLVMVLKTCLETGTTTVLPTKFLEFDMEVAELLKRTQSALLYSIGFDEFEQGAVSHGCNNDFRLDQAVRYREVGVNSNLYLLIKAHAPRTKRENQVIELSKKQEIPIQLLPMRFTSKRIANELLGIPWNRLSGKIRHSLYPDEHTQYEETYAVKSGVLIPEDIHNDWLTLVGENSGLVRMCHHNSETTWCGNCFLKADGFVIPTQDPKLVSMRPKKKKKTLDRTNSLF